MWSCFIAGNLPLGTCVLYLTRSTIDRTHFLIMFLDSDWSLSLNRTHTYNSIYIYIYTCVCFWQLDGATLHIYHQTQRWNIGGWYAPPFLPFLPCWTAFPGPCCMFGCSRPVAEIASGDRLPSLSLALVSERWASCRRSSIFLQSPTWESSPWYGISDLSLYPCVYVASVPKHMLFLWALSQASPQNP